MESATLTRLLSTIADMQEVHKETGSKMKPEYLKKLMSNKFPILTNAQIKHILRVLE